MTTVKLTLPVQQKSQRLLVETDPDRVMLWLNSLPYADMERAVAQVVDALFQFNRTPVPAKKRAGALEHFQHSYEIISGYYRGLSHQLDELPENFLKLTREMSFAYKIVINDMLNARFTGWGQKKKLKSYINLGLHYLGLMLLEHYERYSPIPHHVWNEINQLYMYAEEKGFETEQTERHPHASVILTTIEDTYKRICLCASANPFQLAKGLHWQVFYYLYYYVQHCELRYDSDSSSADDQLAVHIDGHENPGFIEPKKAIATTRFFHTTPLIQVIDQHIDNLKKSKIAALEGVMRGAKPADIISLLRVLHGAWDHKMERSSQRYPKVSQLELCSGITKVHELIRNNDPLQFDVTGFNSTPQPASRAQDMGLKWESVNVSQGGMCIAQPNTQENAKLSIGQLVALKEYVNGQPDDSWSIAIVRWVVKHQNKNLGLEFIRGDIQAISLAMPVTHGDTIKSPALLIKPSGLSPNKSLSIICKRGFFKEDKEFVFEIGDEELQAVAGVCVEQSPFIEHFYIEKL